MSIGDRPTRTGSRPAAGHASLVAFTSLAIAGAGIVVAAASLGVARHLPTPAAFAAGALLMATGLAVSLAHLGQKQRAARAARGAGRSPLSNEAIAAMLALGCAALAAVLGSVGRPSTGPRAIAGLTSAAFLLSIGLAYRLRGQHTWQGPTVFTPLTGGCAFGAIAVQSLAVSGETLSGTLLFMAIDALVFSQRWREVVAVNVPDSTSTGWWWPHRIQWLGARFFLLDVGPCVLLAMWPTHLAAVVAAVGLVLDRVTFYALAVQHTTEHEVAVVESLIRVGSDSTGRRA